VRGEPAFIAVNTHALESRISVLTDVLGSRSVYLSLSLSRTTTTLAIGMDQSKTISQESKQTMSRPYH
jgi:hypothetical protein